MASACTVRLARPDDVPALLVLKWQMALEEGAADTVRAREDDWQRDMFGPRPRFVALLAEAEGVPVGMATLVDRYYPGWVGPLRAIDDLFVLPEHRRRGIGKALVAAAAAEAMAGGAPFVELTVHENNARALRLYERIGFERVPAVTLVLTGNALTTLIGGVSPADESLDWLLADDGATG
jgi:ribosomal protein S18 acetylase RimI-like enzyme